MYESCLCVYIIMQYVYTTSPPYKIGTSQVKVGKSTFWVFGEGRDRTRGLQNFLLRRTPTLRIAQAQVKVLQYIHYNLNYLLTLLILFENCQIAWLHLEVYSQHLRFLLVALFSQQIAQRPGHKSPGHSGNDGQHFLVTWPTGLRQLAP